MWLEGFVADRIAAVIGIPRASLDLGRSLREHGTDSLLALEMIRHIERDLGVRMPVEKILGGQKPQCHHERLVAVIPASEVPVAECPGHRQLG